VALVLVGSLLAGGAAGVAANVAMAPKETPVAATQVPPEVLAQLKSSTEELAKTRAALEESKQRVTALEERVTVGEMKAAKAASATPAANGMRTGRAPRTLHFASGGALSDGDKEALAKGVEIQLDGNELGAQIATALGGLEGAELNDVGGQLAGFRNGLALRQLPEDQRWEKAKDDLGLTWNQVEDMKKAIADRDAATRDAMTTEKKTGPNGGSITIKRPDPAKMAHADADYHDKVAKTLSEDQRKSWQSKGYDHAFGSGPFGGAHGSMVMAIDVATDKAADGAKETK
jgi:hypothetical protein